jgi:hypothetical protein
MAEDLTPTPRDPFVPVLSLFLDAMTAVAELGAFALEHAQQLDGEDEAIEMIASRRLPNGTPEQHRAATVIVRSTFQRIHEAGIQAAADSEEALDADTRKASSRQILDDMRAEIGMIAENPSAFVHYLGAYVEAQLRPARLPVLYASLLTTAVSNFEVLVSGVVREFLSLKPEALRSDDAKYALSEIEGFETLEEFRKYCAERFAEALLRGSFEDWMAWFEKQLKVSLSRIASDPGMVREIFQRRHLFVHNGGKVNRLYLLKFPGLPDLPPIGKKLVVDGEYLTSAVDTLTSIGTLLVALVMRRLVPGNETDHPADTLVSEKAYEFMCQGRFAMTIALTSAMIDDCKSDYSRLIMTVNRWLARKRLEGVEAIRQDVEAWQVSALQPRFALARLALLDDMEEGYKLGQLLLKQEDLSRGEWETWPLFAELRAYEAELAQKIRVSEFADRGDGLQDTDGQEPLKVAELAHEDAAEPEGPEA